MQATCRQIFEEQSVAGIVEKVAPLREIFRLQNADELTAAEMQYLPASIDGLPEVPVKANGNGVHLSGNGAHHNRNGANGATAPRKSKVKKPSAKSRIAKLGVK
jgi:hypothetical protein